MPSSQAISGERAIDPEYLPTERSEGRMASVAEPNRNSAYNPHKPHISTQPLTLDNW